MWELDHIEPWALENWCFWTVVLEQTLESPLYCKEIQPVYPKGDQSWVFIGRTDAEAEMPVLWPPDVKCWPIWKDSDAGKDWGQEEKGMTGDEMVGWHHWLNGQALSKVQDSVMDWQTWSLQSTGSQRVGHDWATELKWYDPNYMKFWKRQKCECNKKIRGCQGLGGRWDWIKWAHRIIVQWQYKIWYYWWIHVNVHFSKSIRNYNSNIEA